MSCKGWPSLTSLHQSMLEIGVGYELGVTRTNFMFMFFHSYGYDIPILYHTTYIGS
jgi:hypothetical protein